MARFDPGMFRSDAVRDALRMAAASGTSVVVPERLPTRWREATLVALLDAGIVMTKPTPPFPTFILTPVGIMLAQAIEAERRAWQAEMELV